MDESFEVVHVEERNRYELRSAGRVIGYADARPQGTDVLFPHVEVDPAYEGRGLGSRLVREALTDVRAKGLRPVPICPFVVAYLRRHPEFAEPV